MFDGEAGTQVRQLGYLDQPLVHRVVAMDILSWPRVILVMAACKSHESFQK